LPACFLHRSTNDHEDAGEALAVGHAQRLDQQILPIKGSLQSIYYFAIERLVILLR
jgi:hypothetical protein